MVDKQFQSKTPLALSKNVIWFQLVVGGIGVFSMISKNHGLHCLICHLEIVNSPTQFEM
jgi:hypothetical protein